MKPSERIKEIAKELRLDDLGQTHAFSGRYLSKEDFEEMAEDIPLKRYYAEALVIYLDEQI